jgi:hypothetical protein
MVAPLIAYGGGAALNLAVEYGYQRYRGNSMTQRQGVTAVVLGALPGVGLVKSLKKGGPIVRQASDVIPFGKLRGNVTSYREEAYALYTIGNVEAGRLVSGSLRGLVANRAIDRYYRPVATSVRSLTSSTQKSGITTRVPGAKRYTAKKTSRRKAFSGDARRKTSYCKTHKKYDFCKKYNIRQ